MTPDLVYALSVMEDPMTTFNITLIALGLFLGVVVFSVWSIKL